MISKELQQKIDAVMAKFAPQAQKMPGVVTVHNLITRSFVWMSELGLKGIGAKEEDLIGRKVEDLSHANFGTDKPPVFIEKLAKLLANNNDDELVSFFEQVKLVGDDDFSWFISSLRILMRDDEGNPVLIVNVSIPIESMQSVTSKAERILQENNFLKLNFDKFAKLSDREKQILRFWAMGKTSSEMAEELFISEMTIETHRKNIRKKLQVTTIYDIQQYALSFDLI